MGAPEEGLGVMVAKSILLILGVGELGLSRGGDYLYHICYYMRLVEY